MASGRVPKVKSMRNRDMTNTNLNDSAYSGKAKFEGANEKRSGTGTYRASRRGLPLQKKTNISRIRN